MSILHISKCFFQIQNYLRPGVNYLAVDKLSPQCSVNKLIQFQSHI